MSILKRPLVTEKMSLLNKRGVYGVVVDVRADKDAIRKEIERFYCVQVDSIRTMRYAGKPKPRYRNTNVVHGKRSAYKKALVTLKGGAVLDFYV